MPMNRRVLLFDNGSLEPASSRQLRAIAGALSARLALPVDPVSLAHSDKIPAEQLDGKPAELFSDALRRLEAEGATEILALPLFIGPSLAVTRWVPGLGAEFAERGLGRAKVRIGSCLYADHDERLCGIVRDHVRAVSRSGARPRVALVDHGSPAPAVTAARDAIGAQLREALGDDVTEVVACSMERREGDDYAFNEPLLARVLERPEWRTGPLVIAMLFIGPGRHAGAGGDVEKIVRAARGDDDVQFTKLLGQHPALIDILVDRARELTTSA